MKQFFTLLSLLVVMGMSVNVMAQSTGDTPAPGATHNYFVTDTGSDFTWFVTVGNLDEGAGSDAVLSSTNGASINITWASDVTVGDWYYVHVVEDDGSCTNEKVMPVQIKASDFYLTLTASKTTQCYDADVDVSLDGNTPNYDHGLATIVYTVTPSGVSGAATGYKFNLTDLAIGPDDTGYSFNVTSSTNANINAGEVTVTDNNPVTITYKVTNGNLYTNVTDASGTAANFTATAVISGAVWNGVADNETGNYSEDTAVSRPATGAISTN